MATIHFITDYTEKETERDLLASISCVTVSSYLKNAILLSSSHDLVILSTAPGRKSSYFTCQRVEKNNRETQVYLAVLKSCESKLIRILNQIISFIQLFFYFLFSVKKDDYVLIYHGYGISKLMWLVRRLVRRKFVFFVGEIYTAVGERSQKEIEQEIRYVSLAHGYIYGNDCMNDMFSFQKPYAVLYSSYQNVENGKGSFCDGKIHAVYAGKIAREIVNDAFLAAECATYLDENYRIHILGYGAKDDLNYLQEVIDGINKEKGYIAVSYDGCLSGEEYDEFLNKCDIGLCTRTLPEPFCNYCFPSKTLIYLSHNLVPICPRIDVISKSDIASSVELIDSMTPIEIATRIKTIKKRKDYGDLMKSLDANFKKQLRTLFP